MVGDAAEKVTPVGKEHLVFPAGNQVDDAVDAAVHLEDVFHVVLAEGKGEGVVAGEGGTGGALEEDAHDVRFYFNTRMTRILRIGADVFSL